MGTTLRRATAAAITVGTVAAVASAPTADAQGGDANGDNLDDIAVGLPGRTVGGDASAGSFMVLPAGTLSGFASFSSDTTGVAGEAEPGDNLGRAFAWGDFDHDGHDDLAVGAPFEDVGALNAAGAVTILEGTASGLTATGSVELTENSPGMAGTAEEDDLFGDALGAGDINRDGYDDLVIDAAREDLGSTPEAGAITIVFGSASGLTTTGSKQLTQNSPGVPSTAAANEFWGIEGLVVADVNGDGFHDIAVSSGYEAVNGKAHAGLLIVLKGSATGVATTGAQLLSEDTSGVPGVAETNDHWSAGSVAAGYINDDQHADLIIGASGENVGSSVNAGAITVLRGSSHGVTSVGSQNITSATAGVPGAAETEDGLGDGATGVGDFNGDHFDDVAVAVPFEDVNGIVDAGAILVLRGSNSGLITTGAKEMHADTSGVAGAAETEDYFSFGNLVAAHLHAGKYDDLVVPIAFEDVGAVNGAGAIVILRGSANGLTGTGSVQVTESPPANSTYFGYALG